MCQRVIFHGEIKGLPVHHSTYFRHPSSKEEKISLTVILDQAQKLQRKQKLQNTSKIYVKKIIILLKYIIVLVIDCAVGENY